MQSFQSFFTLSEIARVGGCFTIAVAVEMVQSHIYPNSNTCENRLLFSLHVNTELGLVAVGTTHNSDSFDLVRRIKMQIPITAQLKLPSSKTVFKYQTFFVGRK